MSREWAPAATERGGFTIQVTNLSKPLDGYLSGKGWAARVEPRVVSNLHAASLDVAWDTREDAVAAGASHIDAAVERALIVLSIRYSIPVQGLMFAVAALAEREAAKKIEAGS